MASFRTVPHGKVEQLNSRLAEAGFDEPLIDFINSKPELVHEWEQSLRRLLKPTPGSMYPGLFSTTLNVWRALVARAKERNWPLSEAQLIATIPGKISRLNRVIVPEVWLGDLDDTLDEHWYWMKSAHPDMWRWEGLKRDSYTCWRLNSERYGTKPFVRWVELDLTANRGKSPLAIRSMDSPSFAVMAAVALHPEWATAIDLDKIPGVWLPGIQEEIPSADQRVPVLMNGRKGLRLRAYQGAHRTQYLAVPMSWPV